MNVPAQSGGESQPESSPTANLADSSTQEHAASLEEQLQLLSGKVDEQYQTKVESASKYRVRLSGIVLMNLFSNRGTVDNADIPHVVLPGTPGQSRGSFGGTLRQSMLGLEVFGPEIAGAKTSAEIQFDFGGGFAEVPNGVTSGLVRLRTATMRCGWSGRVILCPPGSDFAGLVRGSGAGLLWQSVELDTATPRGAPDQAFRKIGASLASRHSGSIDG